LKDVSELFGSLVDAITADVDRHLFAPARRDVADRMTTALWGS
jgi:hypothetical protein